MSDVSKFSPDNGVTIYDIKDTNGRLYTNERIKDTVGFTSKNLIPYPYVNNTQTIKGITFVVNSDGSITLSGTNDGTGNSDFIIINQTVPDFWNNLKNIPLILSGGQSNSIAINYWNANEGSVKDIGQEKAIIFTSNGLSVNHNIAISVSSGTSISTPITVYPMLRLADDLSPTYEPYNPSVKQILRNNKIIEGKNLNTLPYTAFGITKNSIIVNGITWTLNSDGSITANGTATALSSVDCHSRFGLANNMYPLILPNGGYIASGCPSSGGSGKYRMLFARTVNGNPSDYGYDEGNGFELNLQGDDQSSNSVQLTVRCQIENGYTANNVTFYPMIRKATETDPTYEPYYIPGVVSQEANNVLGAKNLFENTAVTVSKNGITMTVNNDKTVTLNGTATEQVVFFITKELNSDAITTRYIDNTKKYILSGCPSDGADNKYFIYDGINNLKDFGEGIALSGKSTYNASIYVRSGVSCSNVIFKPMLRLADIQDDTYTPYAMTNRELTEKVIRTEISNVDLNNITDAGLYYMMGNMTNSPSPNYGMLEVVHKHNYVRQIIYPEAGADRIYTRLRASGTWQSWYQFIGTALS